MFNLAIYLLYLEFTALLNDRDLQKLKLFKSYFICGCDVSLFSFTKNI